MSIAVESALLVERNREQALAVKAFLEQAGFDVDNVEEHTRAFESLSRKGYDIAIVEMIGGKACDFELLQYITRNLIKTATIVTIPESSSRLGTKALELGAKSYLTKPFALLDLGQYVRQAIKSQRNAEEAARVARQRQRERQDRQVIGTSPAIRSVLDLVSSLAESPFTTVLLKGESGTGKDLVANAIHDATFGDRCPFNAVNCAAIPAELLESELFGHEKGAFTGAFQARRGIIELTDSGTLFLDEIAEMPLSLQPKLLRFLDEKTFRRVGGSSDITVQLRVIAATNRHIEKMVETGAFRRDLYFRLSGFPITLPALRERGRDVIHIGNHLVEKYARRYGKPLRGFTPQLEEMFVNYPWPGNIRELKNVIERAVIVSDGEHLCARHVNFDGSLSVAPANGKPTGDITFPLGRPFSHEVAYYEKELIERAIREGGGIKTNAARLLGISRHAFDRLIKRVERLTGDVASAK
jgi:DNA-binding NtrC family response regulator